MFGATSPELPWPPEPTSSVNLSTGIYRQPDNAPPGPQQPRGEFPSIDQTTRADHEAVQVAAASTAISIHL
jgi:hypothetical protein